ncbi:hypothetical protein FRC12_020406 [Ceratobasidium sp. 428]|nr:hypothetical protein FRC12_020406 [Ceratobasidium sp. 428]
MSKAINPPPYEAFTLAPSSYHLDELQQSPRASHFSDITEGSYAGMNADDEIASDEQDSFESFSSGSESDSGLFQRQPSPDVGLSTHRDTSGRSSTGSSSADSAGEVLFREHFLRWLTARNRSVEPLPYVEQAGDTDQLENWSLSDSDSESCCNCAFCMRCQAFFDRYTDEDYDAMDDLDDPSLGAPHEPSDFEPSDHVPSDLEDLLMDDYHDAYHGATNAEPHDLATLSYGSLPVYDHDPDHLAGTANLPTDQSEVSSSGPSYGNTLGLFEDETVSPFADAPMLQITNLELSYPESSTVLHNLPTPGCPYAGSFCSYSTPGPYCLHHGNAAGPSNAPSRSISSLYPEFAIRYSPPRARHHPYMR